ncbi:MAG: hypothetical protein B7C24_13600 [Bacteroidetes bacterium 4572_77]|nr:MAG: hypothetical protein B7C24_13600 [Bacteroidetes bacterium 4572_77]
MNHSFEILDGTLYIDKELYRQSLHTSNNISILTGCNNLQIFDYTPQIRTGIESVTIDYHNSVHITVPKELHGFVTELAETYHNRLRGSLKVCVDNKVVDIILSKF